MDATFTCAYCFQENSIFVDASGGSMQQYIEDCQVCCQPNALFINWQPDEKIFMVESEPAQ